MHEPFNPFAEPAPKSPASIKPPRPATISGPVTYLTSSPASAAPTTLPPQPIVKSVVPKPAKISGPVTYAGETIKAGTFPTDDKEAIDQLGKVYADLKAELGKVIIGQEDVIEQLYRTG